VCVERPRLARWSCTIGFGGDVDGDFVDGDFVVGVDCGEGSWRVAGDCLGAAKNEEMDDWTADERFAGGVLGLFMTRISLGSSSAVVC
jgi:hypothetical protein